MNLWFPIGFSPSTERLRLPRACRAWRSVPSSPTIGTCSRRTPPASSSSISPRRLALLLLLVTFVSAASLGQTPDLTQKSLEDLMNIEVTSVTRTEQKTSQTAAAVFVISSDDIRRSGALNIPDLLRMVPGVEVAQLNGHVWAISVRGFNGQYSNKLLVMIDGRTVYSAIFPGVFWDSESVPLVTIDRIEIIRGPGAAVWGANAVNGVINIITKSPADTQGAYFAMGGGSLGANPERIRYSARLGDVGYYRVYGEGYHTLAQDTPAGGDGKDDWSFAHAGFRTDLDVSGKDFLRTEGRAYRGDAGELADVPVSIQPPVNATQALRDRYSGWNALTQWTRTISPTSQTALKVGFDRTNRSSPSLSFSLNRLDMDFQHHKAWGARQDFVWGLGYRFSSNHTAANPRISFQPADQNLQWFSSFVQDEIVLVPDRLRATLGMRIEHNTYTGHNFQPSIRMVWTPRSTTTLWGAISGADRTPSMIDRSIRNNFQALPGPGGMPLLVAYLGNPNSKNEHVTAFEAGFRKSVSRNLSFDSTAFYNWYESLQSAEPQPVVLETEPSPTHLLLAYRLGNGLFGETHGFEAFANWKPMPAWTLSPGYAFLALHIHHQPSSYDLVDGPGTEGGVPHHQAWLRSQVQLPHGWEWDASAYFVDRLMAASTPSYTRVDSNLNWHFGGRFSLSLVGQNLLKSRHIEYAGPNTSVQAGAIRRQAFAKITWSF